MFTLKGKMLIGVGLVLTIVGTLTISSLWAILSYRDVVSDLDRHLNSIPQRRELIEAFAAMLEPLQARLPDDTDGCAARQWLFQDRLANAEVRTGEATTKLARLPSQPGFAAARDLAQERLWEIDHRLGEMRREQRLLLDPKQTNKARTSLRNQVNALQDIAAGIPDFGTSLPQLLVTSRQTYRASLWWVSISTGLVVMLLVVGLFAGRRWISRPWKKLLEGTHRVAQGKFDYRVRLDTRDEFAELADSFNRMTDRFVETRDKLERDARELAEQLTRQERLAGLGFLSAGIAHELNNPLTAIRWTSESLLTRFATLFGNVSPQNAAFVENYLKMIQCESSRCQQITAKLLDFARGGDGLRANQDLTQIIHEVMHLVRAMSKYRECEIVFDRSEPCVLEVNGNEIKQVVLNLVANGLDAIEDATRQVNRRPRLSGSSLASLSNSESSSTVAGRLEIRLNEFTDHVELEFQDTGCGMSADVLRRIFDPFFTTKPTGQGTGLGLPICHRIVTEHGGRLAAASAGSGCGSTFRLSLPRVANSQQKVA
ncbi:MAG: HAMP domain-containing protein [Planctomycetes bacterium]|nr:HAMP domain-containing protein [Planctomycetota bacterium]